MRNMSGKVIISFVIGLVAGGVATYYVTKKKIQEAADASVEEQVKDIRERYKEELKKTMNKNIDDTINNDPNLKKVADENGVKFDAADYAEETPKPVHMDKKDISKEEARAFAEEWAKTHDGPVYDDATIQRYEKYANAYMSSKYNGSENVIEKEPYVISADRYGEYDSYSCINLTYYDGDCTLADSSDTVIEDIEKVVGDALDHFGDDPNDPDTVFVRNERYMTDYEINRDERSYLEMCGI